MATDINGNITNRGSRIFGSENSVHTNGVTSTTMGTATEEALERGRAANQKDFERNVQREAKERFPTNGPSTSENVRNTNNRKAFIEATMNGMVFDPESRKAYYLDELPDDLDFDAAKSRYMRESDYKISTQAEADIEEALTAPPVEQEPAVTTASQVVEAEVETTPPAPTPAQDEPQNTMSDEQKKFNRSMHYAFDRKTLSVEASREALNDFMPVEGPNGKIISTTRDQMAALKIPVDADNFPLGKKNERLLSATAKATAFGHYLENVSDEQFIQDAQNADYPMRDDLNPEQTQAWIKQTKEQWKSDKLDQLAEENERNLPQSKNKANAGKAVGTGYRLTKAAQYLSEGSIVKGVTTAVGWNPKENFNAWKRKAATNFIANRAGKVIGDVADSVGAGGIVDAAKERFSASARRKAALRDSFETAMEVGGGKSFAEIEQEKAAKIEASKKQEQEKTAGANTTDTQAADQSKSNTTTPGNSTSTQNTGKLTEVGEMMLRLKQADLLTPRMQKILEDVAERAAKGTETDAKLDEMENKLSNPEAGKEKNETTQGTPAPVTADGTQPTTTEPQPVEQTTAEQTTTAPALTQSQKLDLVLEQAQKMQASGLLTEAELKEITAVVEQARLQALAKDANVSLNNTGEKQPVEQVVTRENIDMSQPQPVAEPAPAAEVVTVAPETQEIELNKRQAPMSYDEYRAAQEPLQDELAAKKAEIKKMFKAQESVDPKEARAMQAQADQIQGQLDALEAIKERSEIEASFDAVKSRLQEAEAQLDATSPEIKAMAQESIDVTAQMNALREEHGMLAGKMPAYKELEAKQKDLYENIRNEGVGEQVNQAADLINAKEQHTRELTSLADKHSALEAKADTFGKSALELEARKCMSVPVESFTLQSVEDSVTIPVTGGVKQKTGEALGV